MPKLNKDSVAERRQRKIAQGLKELSSVWVPVYRVQELREIAERWTAEHLAQRNDLEVQGNVEKITKE